MLPALSRAKARAQQLSCLNNLKQLTTCWHLYADDYADTLALNNPVDAPSWTVGADNTNPTNIRVGLLWPYSRSLGVYRCPSDHTVVDGVPRVRSYALNGQLGSTHDPSGAPWDSQASDMDTPGYPPTMKLTQMVNPAPAARLAFVDESELTIDDGYFLISLPQTDGTPNDTWGNVPAVVRHQNNRTSFSFADAHAEAWKWHDPRTPAARLDVAQPGNLDLRRLQAA